MNESEFESLWNSEKAMYLAWGEYVVEKILQQLEDDGENLDIFLKVPVNPRV